MTDLSTEYMGLALRNPLVASPSPLSHSLDGIRRLAGGGVGAIVMFSLFEEQLRERAARNFRLVEDPAESFPEAVGYFPAAARLAGSRLSVYSSTLMAARERTATRPASAPHVRADPVYVAKAQLFRVLGHPVRIRILELLRDGGELTVGELQAALRLDSSGTSQHLGALRQQGVLESRRAGACVYYRLRDPRVSQLLAVAKEILASALSESHTLLEGLAEDSAQG